MSGGASIPERPTLWRHPDFLKLWGAAATSAFGARIAREGLPMVAVITLGANPAQVGLLAALSRGPALLVGLFGGGPVDRSAKRPILIGADLLRAVILAAVPFAALTHSLNLWLVYACAAVVGAANALFEITHHAYLPSLVPKDQLVDGNAKLSTTDAVAEVGGPALAGGLIQMLTAPIAIWVNVATYLVSALFLGLIRTPEKRLEPQGPPEHFLSDARDGARAILAHHLVRPVALMEVGANLFGAFFSALYTLYALRTLGLSPALMGLTVALGGIGGVAGALLTPVLVRQVGIGRAFVGLGVTGALFNFAIPLAPANPIGGAAALGFAQLFGDALMTGAFILNGTMRQSLLPGEVLGRASGAIAAAAGLAGIVGALAGGWLGVVAGPRIALWVAASGILAAVLVPLFSPVRRYRETA